MTRDDLEREIVKRLNADPTIRALFARFGGRQPSYLYWQTPDGRMFLYTTETFSDGKYVSAIYQPVGKGSRSGKAAVREWKPTREVHHRTRKAARTRALTLYQKARGGAWTAADQLAQDERNRAARVRYYQKTGRWYDDWGPKP